jgi:protein-S-isoprenylcysteine O-methyltransferase Ste14
MVAEATHLQIPARTLAPVFVAGITRIRPHEAKEPIMAQSLGRRSFEAVAQFLVFLAALILLPAWSLRYWQGWLFLGVFSAAVIFITAYFLRVDPGLVERRLKAGAAAETRKSQKRVQTFASILVCLLVLLPVLDHRFGWSAPPAAVSILGDGLVALGFLVIFLVFRVNSFTSGVVEIGQDQKVITTGPYAIVRHPMYSGALVMFAGIPLALGSWWGLLLVLPMAAVLVLRLVDEEKFLDDELPGYREYRRAVRCRLVPAIY